MSIKLSICIPTYNRAMLLAQTLENVIAQATGEVEIVVSDNASPDNTEEVVRGLQKRFPRLTYFRQPENRGADRNYLQTVALAQGEWCWLLGDDDLLEPGAISYLLGNYLNESRPLDFALLLVTSYDSEMKTVLQRSADILGITEDIYTTDVPAFFQKFFQESYLSIFVVRRALWNRINPEPYVGTGLTYLGITYEYLQVDAPVVLIARSLVRYRGQNVSWTGSALDIILTHQRTVIDLLPARYDPVKEAAYGLYQKRTPVTLKMLCYLRSQGSYSLRDFRHYLADYFGARPAHRAAAWLIAAAPTALMRSLRSVYQSLRSSRKAART